MTSRQAIIEPTADCTGGNTSTPLCSARSEVSRTAHAPVGEVAWGGASADEDPVVGLAGGEVLGAGLGARAGVVGAGVDNRGVGGTGAGPSPLVAS